MTDTSPRTDVRVTDCFFEGNNLDGSPVFSVTPEGTVCVTMHGWTCFGPDDAGRAAFRAYASSIERAHD
jgi:hypothetical protein